MRSLQPNPHHRAPPPLLSSALGLVLCCMLMLVGGTAAAGPANTAASNGSAAALQELHHRVATSAPGHAQDLVLTLDACGGGFDRKLIDTLVQRRVPATLFVTQRWLARNPEALRTLRAHPDLFELENHGHDHIPAVVGRRLYGMPGAPDRAHLENEVRGGAQAVAQASGRAPTWFRGAGAAYDSTGQAVIQQLGYRIAGFSLNADAGASLSAQAVAQRLRRAKPGDLILAHMNHPESGTAAGVVSALPELQNRGLHFIKLSQAQAVVALPDRSGKGVDTGVPGPAPAPTPVRTR